mmetsp:Transcript_30249/g.70824  ORF Transcript_30249/g.70824 Transcript_30249/m.70824 type:complete len:645 (+) Transcript_30249:65-1999(+)
MVSFPTFRRGIQAQDKVTGDRAVASLHNLLRDGTSEEKITKLRGEADTVWLAYHPDTVVCFVHRVTVIGGTRLQPEVSIWALVGDGASAYPVKWAVADVSRYREVTAAASWTNVKDVDSAEALTNAPAGQHDVQMPDLIPLPPSIACNLMDEPDRHPAALMRPLRTAVLSHDNGKEQDADAFLADDHVRSIARWLWAAHNGRLNQIPLVPSTLPEVVSWADDIRRATITGAAAPQAGGAGQAAAGQAPAGGGQAAGAPPAAGTADVVTALFSLREELKVSRLNKEIQTAKSKPGFKSFPLPVQKMIEHASQSVTQTGVVMGGVNQEAKDFFASQNAGHAILFLQTSTEGSKYKIPAQDKAGLATRLYKGGLKWTSPGVPNGMTLFACAPGDVMADSGSDAAVGMSLASSEGSGLTDTQQRALLSQKLSYPRQVDAAKKQLKLFAAILLMLFGQSELQIFVDLWLDHMIKNETAYETCVRMDDAFFLKMFYFIDKAVQVFLSACERATNRTRVPDEVFESNQYKRDILMHQSPFNMPSQFQDPARSSSTAEEESDWSPKKKKAKNRIENTDPVSALIVDPNRFQARFGRDCDHYQRRPTIRGRKMCVTFHLLGYCYEGCSDSASHVKLNPNEEGNVKGYIAKCRA